MMISSWNKGIDAASQWHLEEALKEEQTSLGCAFHLIVTFLYNVPLLNYLCFLIGEVAQSILHPQEVSVPKRDPIYGEIHEKMDGIFRRQEKKNVLLVGPTGVGKEKVAHSYPRDIILLTHYSKMEYQQLAKLFRKHNGNIVLCATKPIAHEELVRRYCTEIKVKEPSDTMVKKIVSRRFPMATKEVIDQSMELCHFYLSNQCQPGLLLDIFDGVYAYHGEITVEQVKEHIHERTQAPIRLPNERRNYYRTAELVLKGKVFGQDHVIEEIAKVLETCGNGQWTTGVPVFHFAGPTGVGKTELAKAIGAFFYESETRFLHVSMSQYGEPHTASALTGTTPGYVGFEMGGQIQEKAKEGPFVLLLDEIDKAHPKVIASLIQHVAEEGVLYDPKTQTDISLKGSIIVMTSNLGTKEIEQSQEGWGAKPDTSDPTAVEEIVFPVIKSTFPPDLLARFHTFYFTPHTDEEVVKRIVIQFLEEEQKKHSCTLTWTNEYVEAFLNMEKIKKEGVRWIRRNIQTTLRHQILRSSFSSGATIRIDWDGKKDLISLAM